MFLLNSRLLLCSATGLRRYPFSRSYRVILPNSLTVILSSALVCSTQPPVSVYGTGVVNISSSGFSWESDYLLIHLRMRSRYSQVRFPEGICLLRSASTPFNRLFRQPAGVSLLRPHFPIYSSMGILTHSSIGYAVRLLLRARLTLIRLTLIRKPWSFGVRVSLPHYRYSYLHLLFQSLQFSSPKTFYATGMLPYQSYLKYDSTASAGYLCPIIIHARSLD